MNDFRLIGNKLYLFIKVNDITRFGIYEISDITVITNFVILFVNPIISEIDIGMLNFTQSEYEMLLQESTIKRPTLYGNIIYTIDEKIFLNLL